MALGPFGPVCCLSSSVNMDLLFDLPDTKLICLCQAAGYYRTQSGSGAWFLPFLLNCFCGLTVIGCEKKEQSNHIRDLLKKQTGVLNGRDKKTQPRNPQIILLEIVVSKNINKTMGGNGVMGRSYKLCD